MQPVMRKKTTRRVFGDKGNKSRTELFPWDWLNAFQEHKFLYSFTVILNNPKLTLLELTELFKKPHTSTGSFSLSLSTHGNKVQKWTLVQQKNGNYQQQTLNIHITFLGTTNRLNNYLTIFISANNLLKGKD